MDVKQAGDVVYVLGETRNELGAGEYLALRGQLGVHVPRVDVKKARRLYEKLSAATAKGFIASCHDCSDGGLGVALAESAFAGGYGMDVDLARLGVAGNVVALFSESASRFVVTVSPRHTKAFEKALAGCAVARIGTVIPEEMFRVRGHGGFDDEVPLSDLKEAWQRPLRW